jgi:AcrR family transcriptional regulator
VTPSGRSDGRSSRWTEHRRVRRVEFVTAAVESVRRTGPELAVDDVARTAGVSKTVLYRYFTDKDELVDAVLEQISTEILLPRLLGELALDRATDQERLRAVVAAFVAIIEEEPALYRFAYAQAGRSGRADLVAQTEREVAEALAWGSSERSVTSAELVDQLTALAWGGLSALLPPAPAD